MATFTQTIDLPAPPDEVFAYVADQRHAADWHPAIISARRSDDIVEVGTVTDSVFVFYTREIPLAFEITELDGARLMVAEASSRRARAREEFVVEPGARGGTRLAYHSELRLGGLLRVLDRGLQVAFDSIGERAAKGLRTHFV